MSIIIDLVDYVEILNMKLKHFKKTHKVDPGKPTEKQCLDLVYKLIDTRITNLMKWAKPDRFGKFDAIKEVFTWWQPNSKEELHLDFYEEVIEELEVELKEVLGNVANKPTWNIVDIRRTGTSCIIVKGEDYRIVDWHRIQEERKKNTEEGAGESFPIGI